MGWFLLLLVVGFSCSPLWADEYLIHPCETQVALASIRSLDFEKHVHASPRSYAALNPQVHAQLLELYDAYPGWEAAFPRGLKRGMAYRDAILQLLSLKQHIAQRLMKIRTEMKPYDRGLANLLERTARSLEHKQPKPHAGWVERVHFANVETLRRDVRDDRMMTLERRASHNDAFLSLAHRVRTIWGELRAAMLMPDLLAYDEVVENLWRHTNLFPSFGMGREKRGIKQTNIDLVWSSGGANPTLHIGEVKSYFTALQYSQEPESHWEQLVEQLSNLEHVGENAHVPTQIHVILINGIGKKAFDALTDLGYRVHAFVM